MDALTYPDRTPHTGLLELKQVYRPVRVTKGDKDGVFLFESTLEFISADSIMDCHYEITDETGVISEGKVSFSLSPMGRQEICLPEAVKDYKKETYIRFIFTANSDTLYWDKGYEICFNQLPLTERISIENAPESSGEVSLAETSFYVTVVAENVTYRFNKRLSTFDSIAINGRDILDKPLMFNFFRAPVDNDVMKNDWYSAHLHDSIPRNYGVTASLSDNVAEITLRQSYGWSIHQPVCNMDVKYRISANGLDIESKAEFSNKVTFLPRFGIRLFMPKDFDKVEYFGYGPYESYIDKHQASYMGSFSAKISDMHEDYIRPQENGSHYGCRYMTLTDGATEISFTAPESFSFNASEYTEEELANKRHNFELQKCESNVICVDSAMAGVGSNACGPVLAEKYKLPLPEISMKLNIKVK